MTPLRYVARHRDPALAAGLAVLYAVEVLGSGQVAERRGSAALVGVLVASSLVVRRTMPFLPLLAGLGVIQLNDEALPGLAEGGTFMLFLLIAIFSAGSYLRGARLVVAGLLVAVMVPLAALDPRQPPAVGDWVFFVAFFGAPFVAGVFFRRRRDRDEELAQQARLAIEDGERRVADAVTEERARIARELHDVVAHAISVIVVQARAGRRVLGDDVDAAQSSFDAIEHTGEQALDEMRRLLTLLRDAGDRADLDPQAGLDRIPALAEQFQRSGLPVEVRCEGEPVGLPPGVDLSAYRIVQEALTNVLKHAGPARARVVLRHRPDELEVEVVDDGDGSGAGGGSGHGLAGIRERVAVYGGLLEVGPSPDGGFAVRARLPLRGTT